ncbi:hypothetical protein [Raoultella sp. FYR_9]|uniref:hypothetical protein n=1 Tax=Raoultella sp. FYR_9 TaxID=3367176 RepID=UPI00370AF09E
MKTPVQMLEDVAAEIIENTVLLELIYKNSNEDQETDCAMACLIRSMQKTLDITNEYIKEYSDASAPPQRSKGGVDIKDEIFGAVLTAKKLEEVASVYGESYFTDKDNDNPSCHMSAVISDYAIKVCRELETIQSKLG